MVLSSRALRRSVLSLLWIVSGVCAAQPAKSQFGSSPEVELTGGRVTSFVTGVFQSSGLATDILYTNAPTGSGAASSVLVGLELNGQGFTNLGENQIVFTGVANAAAAVADFDGDGYTDFAFVLSPTSGSTGKLCVYYGTGAQAPSPSNPNGGGSSYNAGNIPNAYPPTGGKSGCTAFAVQGNAAPNFAYATTLRLQAGLPPQLLVEDSSNNNLYIFANNGTPGVGGALATFTLLNTIAIPPADGTGPIYTGNFVSGSRNTDFILNGQTDNTATVYLGDGTGNFASQGALKFDHNVHSMLMHDMDGDGIADMVVEGDQGVVEIFKGNANGTFAMPSEGGTAAGLNGFSGDGGHLATIDPSNLDILTTTPIGLSLLRNQGSGSLSYSLKKIYDIGPGRTSFALGDFFATGVLDLAVDSPEGIAIALGDGSGGFETANAYAALAPALGSTAGKFRNAAHNPNGYVDVVVATGATQAQLLAGNGDGTFTTFPGVVDTGAGPGNVPASVWSNILSGDFNGDGYLDVLYSLTGLPASPPSPPFPILYFQYGNGDGTFGASGSPFSVIVASSNPDGYYPETAVGDFNGDGIADAALSDAFFDGTLLGMNAPPFCCTGGFNQQDSNNTSFSQVAAGFFKTGRLSKQDLVFEQGASFIPYVNSGDGVHFTAMTPLTGAAPPLYPATVLLTDVDGDGNGDLVVVYYNTAANAVGANPVAPNQVQIWWGNGDGRFATPQVLSLSRNYYLGAVADMNSDGLPDLVLSDGSVVSILYNQGNRGFGTVIPTTGFYTSEQHFLAGQGINSLTLADVNGDGKPDLVVANGGATISNAIAIGGKTQASISLTANPDVNTGGITVLMNNITTKPVTGLLTATPDPVAYQGTFTLTATLTPSAGVALPTGSVQFYIDGSPVGGAIPVVAGTNSSSASYVVAAGNTYIDGPHTLTAIYSGDTVNSQITLNGTEQIQGGPTTTILYLCIGPAVSCPSTGSVVPPPPPYPTLLRMYYGQTFNGVAQTTANDGSTITGTIAFDDNYAGPGIAPVNPLCTLLAGQAGSCPPAVGVTVGTGVGTNVFTAVYSGDASHFPSSSPAVTILVSPDLTSGATLIGSPNPSPVGQPVTFTAMLTGNYAAPTGPMVFAFGSTVLCASANLVPNATGLSSTATCTTSALPVGTDAITATYAATLDFDAATFPAFSETITPSLSGGFALAVTPNPVNVATGYGAVLTVTVSGQNGFAQGVNLACANLPAETTCSFGSAAIGAGGGSTTLLLSTTAPHSCGTTQPYFNSGNGPGLARMALPALAGLILIFIPGKRRWLRALVAAVVVAGATQMTGCGDCTDLGTRPATYTFQVTGTAATSSSAVSQPVTLNVTL